MKNRETGSRLIKYKKPPGFVGMFRAHDQYDAENYYRERVEYYTR